MNLKCCDDSWEAIWWKIEGGLLLYEVGMISFSCCCYYLIYFFIASTRRPARMLSNCWAKSSRTFYHNESHFSLCWNNFSNNRARMSSGMFYNIWNVLTRLAIMRFAVVTFRFKLNTISIHNTKFRKCGISIALSLCHPYMIIVWNDSINSREVY